MGDIRLDQVISIDNQAAYDLDWFGVDRNGLIGHFASGGCGTIPPIVVNDNLARLRALHYFSDIAPTTTSVRVMSVVGKKLISGTRGFFSSYDSMSVRGLFSFSAQDTGVLPVIYELVTKPTVPLNIDSLPVEVARLISNNVVARNFTTAAAVTLCRPLTPRSGP